MIEKRSRPAEGNPHRAASDREGAGPAEHSSAKVEISRDHYWQLVFDAEAWRALLRSPHITDLLGEWAEWRNRRLMSESTAEMSAMFDWRAVANRPTYRELERRRRLTSVAPCGQCGRQVELVHPLPEHRWLQLPDLSWVRCLMHAQVAA